MDIVTSDLSKFGYREQELAQDILTAWRKHGLPEDQAYIDEIKG